jgi:multidrug efflux pump
LAGAVIISGIVALTLSPMMCARLLKREHPSRYSQWLSNTLTNLQNCYQQALRRILAKRKWVVAALVLAAVTGIGFYHFLSSELAPREDMGQVYVSVTAPQSASFQYTDGYTRQIEPVLAKTPEIDSYLSMMYMPNYAFQFLKLKPLADRKHTTAEIIASLSSQLSTLPGVNVQIFAPQPPLAQIASGSRGDNVGMVIMTTRDYPKLQGTVQRIVNELQKNPGFVHVDNELKWDSEQFQISIDRESAADLRVPMSNITNTISTLVAGRTVGKMDDADVLIRLNESVLANPNIISELYVRNLDGKVIPLSSLVSIRSGSSPETFSHYGRLRSDTIYVTLAPDYKMDVAVKALEKVAKENLTDDMKFTFTGEAKSFIESAGKTLFTFLLALVFIYLVLVAQFESFIDPLIILLTVPFAMIGAIITLKIFGGSLNIYSNIGMITLIGLIAKHGILITEFANRLRAEGKSVNDAVIEAAMLRLRPILMTTAAMVLGALPLAVAFGPGAESRQQVGLVIAGGLLFGTFFSLIVVPVAYTYLAPFRRSVVSENDEVVMVS